MPAYEQDLAHIHDVGFGHFAHDTAPGLFEILHRAGIDDGRVVDLGCGSGLWARKLVDAGYDVTGIDISRAMIDLARNRVPEGDFHLGSCLARKLPTCRAVTALGEVLNYQFDKRSDLAAIRRLCKRIHAVLRPGGLFIFDVAQPRRNKGPAQRFWEAKDWSILVEYQHDAKLKRLTRRIVTFRKVGQTYRRREETHQLRLYERSEIVDLLRAIGFRVRTVREIGTFQFPPGWLGFVARKV